MDYKLFLATFVTIFLAELGDKTQFAAVAASAGTKSTITVLLAVVLALSIAGALGVVAGRFIGMHLSPELMRWMSGGLFVIIGVWILFFRK